MRKIFSYVVIALALISILVYPKKTKNEKDVWGDFAESVLSAGNVKDCNALNKLSMAPADDKVLMALLKKSNPQIEILEIDEKPTDAEIKKAMECDARLFINSYEDVFDGELVSVITCKDASIKGVQIYSLIVWVKNKDDKFRGIKIDNVWKKDDGTIKVLTWAELSGYYVDKNVKQKKAILERDRLDDCDYPDWIKYQYSFTD